jgi:hypothetical protein
MALHVALKLQAADGLYRTLSRLHTLAIDIDALHYSGDEMCLHLASAEAHRVMSVLRRSLEVTQVDTPGRCLRPPSPAVPLHSRYVTWRAPLTDHQPATAVS